MKSSLVGAVDIGGTKVSVGLADTGGNVIIEQEFPTVKGMDGADQSLKRTVHILEEQCRTLHIKVEDLLGIGVVCAGPVNVKKGTIENPYTLPGWEGYPIVDNLKKSIRLPVVLENDANGALLGEILLKKLEKEKVLMITFGTGIGVACWERGNVYAEGDYHPEMGHIVIASYGENCYCRHKGCFESLCSGAALNERALRLGFRDFDHAYRGYQENNSDADNFIRMVRTEMKAGIWNLNLIFKPDDIILGGGLMKDYFTFVSEAALEDTIDNYDFVKKVRILQSCTDKNPALAGAAMLIKEIAN